jgi:hypothetical protein
VVEQRLLTLFVATGAIATGLVAPMAGAESGPPAHLAALADPAGVEPSPDNCLRPERPGDEFSALPPRRFRACSHRCSDGARSDGCASRPTGIPL